jgi:hypothetical protein
MESTHNFDKVLRLRDARHYVNFVVIVKGYFAALGAQRLQSCSGSRCYRNV